MLYLCLVDLFTISDAYFTSIFKTSLLLSVCFFLIEGNIKQYWADKNNTKLICKIVCHLVTVYTLHHCIWNSEQLGGFVFAEDNSLYNADTWMIDRHVKSRYWRFKKNKEKIKHRIAFQWKGKKNG